MSAKIYNFPNQTEKESIYSINLYDDEQADVFLVCLSLFCSNGVRYNLSNIYDIESKEAINCLYKAKNSDYFSDYFKKIVDIILDNVIFE